MTNATARIKLNPKTGKFSKIADGRRNRVYLNDAEVNFIELWRQARELGQKYASEKGKQLIKEIRDELGWDYVSFVTGCEFSDEFQEFFTRCSTIMSGVFGSYEEEENLEVNTEDLKVKATSGRKRVVKNLSCYAQEDGDMVVWTKVKRKLEYRL